MLDLPSVLLDIPHHRNVPFSKLTTLGIGGFCDWLFEPISEKQAQFFVNICHKEGINWRIIGCGSNILTLGDIKTPILRLNFRRNLHISGAADIDVPANYNYINLSVKAANMGFSGLEYAVGIPGTLGGAAYMNAGAHGYTISDNLIRYRLLTKEGYLVEDSPSCDMFDYRCSKFNNSEIILGLTFRLVCGKKDTIKLLMDDYCNKRRKTQPIGKRSAGCFFKNPPGYNAGYLIEQAGLKGFRMGDVGISNKHANFLINYGTSNSMQFYELVLMIQNKVKDMFGIKLEAEVRIWKD